MLQYILIALAGLAVFSGPSLATSGPMTDYAVAVGIALMLKPWLQGHIE